MASRLPKYALAALGLTVTLAMTALGGAALAGGALGQVNPLPATQAGTLRTESESEATDQSATEEEAVDPAWDEEPAASEPSDDEPSADAYEEEATDEPESE